MRRVNEFDIPAQPAVDALNAFSRESGLRLLFPYEAIENKQVRAIQGELTVEEVLDRLLIEVGLTIASREGNVVTLRVPSTESTTLHRRRSDRHRRASRAAVERSADRRDGAHSRRSGSAPGQRACRTSCATRPAFR